MNNIILNLGIGDAYGSFFEYASPDLVLKYNSGKKYSNFNSIGKYTDDTQMTIAISEMMLSSLEWTTENIANYFVQCFKRDERDGYASKFHYLLKKVNSGKELLEKIINTSDRSGAAMRASVIGLYKNINEVIEKSTIQASITHNTESGIESAVNSSLMTYYFVNKIGPKKDLPKWIQSKSKLSGWDKEYVGQVGEKGWMSVQAAITSISKCDNMESLLKMCISFTGDVDTVAAIALAAATFSEEISKNLNETLYTNLENGIFGKDYLIFLGNSLNTRYL